MHGSKLQVTRVKSKFYVHLFSLFRLKVAEVEKSLASCTDKELARQLEVALGSVKTSNYARDFTLEHYLFQPFSSRQSSSSGVHSRGNRYSQMSTVGKYVDLRNRSHSLLNKEETVPL